MSSSNYPQYIPVDSEGNAIAGLDTPDADPYPKIQLVDSDGNLISLGSGGDSSGAVLAHENAINPHPQYTTDSEVKQLITANPGIQSGLFTAAIALSALRVVTLSSGFWIYASSDQESHGNAAIGLLLAATNQGTACRSLLQGSASDLSWNWSVGQPIFLGLNGLLTQSQPTQFRRIVAFPLSTTEIFFNPQEAIFL